MDPNQQQQPNPTPPPTPNADTDSLKDVLEKEAVRAPVDPLKLQEAAQKADGTSKDFNPYQQQQVKPGQIIGYGIPTDQKVEIPIVKGRKHLPRKFWRTVLYFGIFLVISAVLAGLALLANKIANV